MTFYSKIETKSAEKIETKAGGEVELTAKFTEYHDATKTALAELRAELKAERENADELEAKMNRLSLSGGTDSKAVEARNAEAERKAYGRFVKTGDETELKSLNAGSDPEGGYLTATALSQTINQRIFDQSPIRRLARVITLTSGTEWAEPIDNSDVGAEWIGEKDSRPETDPASLEMLTIPLNEIYATQVVTQKLLDLSFADIGAWIEGKIADKFARSQGYAYLLGNGINKPRGILDYATSTDGDATRAAWTLQFVNSGSAATVADANGQANGIKDLYWSLRAPYRNNATWVMASATANGIDKLKDSNGDYIWRNGMTSGSPDELLGRPVEFDENMPAVGAGALPIAFGDFKKAYTIVDWSGIKSLRDPYTEKPNVVFYAYRRTGGGLSDSHAVKFLKCSA